MKVVVCKDYAEVSAKAADIMASQVRLKPNCVLGLATGSTPIGLYNELIRKHSDGELDFSDVTSFNLDEYYPISPDNDQSYRYFMNKQLFSHINIKPENTHVPNGMCDNTDEECEAYEEAIRKSSGIDLQLLGIGQNGHIGFNEPSANLNAKTHLTALTENTIEANSRFFESKDEVPTKALTMGMGTILQAKKIIILATGASKHTVVKALLDDNINTSIPATLLKLHPDVTLLCDVEAYESLRIGVDLGGTDMKIGVVDDDCNILEKWTHPTPKGVSADELADFIAEKCLEIAKKYPINSIGVGSPGLIRNGKVTAFNLNISDYPFASEIASRTKIPTKLSNDANCAALGEARCGVARNADNCIMLTLGTGVGGGIIINNEIYEGNGSAGELGHVCFEYNGKQCACGLKGCLEQYASATALVAIAEDEASSAPDSILGKKYTKAGNVLNGIMIFESIRENCPVAAKALDIYTDRVAAGINGLIYAFDPEMVIISGGISNAGDLLLNPIVKKVNFNVPIKIAELKSDAGLIGAAVQ